jgi:hypothetical protein
MKDLNKNRMAWTISVLFLVAFSSCSKDKLVEQSPAASEIRFTAEQAGLTLKSAPYTNSDFWVEDGGSTLKTSLLGLTTSWKALTDKAGIYSPDVYRSTTNSGTPDGVVNGQYSANSTSFSSAFTATTPIFYSSITGTPTNFYAYYPWVTGKPAVTLVPIEIPYHQTQSGAGNSDHMGLLDFMVATPVIVPSPAPGGSQTGTEVHLKYNHVFTIIEFDITGTGTLAALTLSGANLAGMGKIDISKPTPGDGIVYAITNIFNLSDDVTVILTTPALLTSTVTKVYMVVNPGWDGSCNIAASADGDTFKTLATHLAPPGGFLRGHYYTVSLTGVAIP